jgi:hypothetical protein
MARSMQQFVQQLGTSQPAGQGVIAFRGSRSRNVQRPSVQALGAQLLKAAVLTACSREKARKVCVLTESY